MTKPSLSQLLRNDAAVAAVGAFLRDLEPASAGLARDLAVLHAPAHTRRGHAVAHASRPTQAAAPRREPGWQWGALAACLIAAVALFAARGAMSPVGTESALAQSPLQSDHIFGWSSGRQVASEHSRTEDRIFSSRESGGHDQIFDGGFGGGGMH